MKWIDIKSQLPKQGTEVLIYFKCPQKKHMHRMHPYNPCSQIVMGRFDDGWCDLVALDGIISTENYTDFTHWMPLPEAPQRNKPC